MKFYDEEGERHLQIVYMHVSLTSMSHFCGAPLVNQQQCVKRSECTHILKRGCCFQPKRETGLSIFWLNFWKPLCFAYVWKIISWLWKATANHPSELVIQQLKRSGSGWRACPSLLKQLGFKCGVCFPSLATLLHIPADFVGASRLGYIRLKHILFHYGHDVFSYQMRFVHFYVLCTRGIIRGIQGRPTAWSGGPSPGEAMWSFRIGLLLRLLKVFVDKDILKAYHVDWCDLTRSLSHPS